MPLSTWTERDELLSDALHMRDVGLGFDRELTIESYLDADDESGIYYAALKDASHGHLDVADDVWRERGKPVLTADDKDDVATASWLARRAQRWLDGRAAAEFVELARKADLALIEREIDELLDLDEDAPEWERQVAFEQAGELFDQLADTIVEEGGEIPTHQIPLANLASYVETMLYTGRGACSLQVRAQGHAPFSTRKAAEKLLPRLRERGQQERAVRARARLKVQPDAFHERHAGPGMSSPPVKPVRRQSPAQRATADYVHIKWPVIQSTCPFMPDSLAIRLNAQIRMGMLRLGAYKPYARTLKRTPRFAHQQPPVEPTLCKHTFVDGTVYLDRGRKRHGRMVRISRDRLAKATVTIEGASSGVTVA